MKHKLTKLIAMMLAMSIMWQGVVFAQPDSLRPLAFKEGSATAISSTAQQMHYIMTAEPGMSWEDRIGQAQQMLEAQHPTFSEALTAISKKDYTRESDTAIVQEFKALTNRFPLTAEEEGWLALSLRCGQVGPRQVAADLRAMLETGTAHIGQINCFRLLDDWHQDFLRDAIFELYGLTNRPEACNIIAAVISGEYEHPEQAVKALKAQLPELDEATLAQLVEKALKLTARAEGKPAQSYAIDLRTISEVLADMYRGGQILCDTLDEEVQQYLSREPDEIIRLIQEILSGIADKSNLSLLRFDLANRLINANRPALALRLLKEGIPQQGDFPLVYIIRYYHLMGRACKTQGSFLLSQRRQLDEALDAIKAAEENFAMAIKLTEDEDKRLNGLSIDPLLEGERNNAIRELAILKRGIDSDIHLADCYKVEIIVSMPPSGISRHIQELVEGVTRIRNSELRDNESLRASEQAMKVLTRALGRSVDFDMLRQKELLRNI